MVDNPKYYFIPHLSGKHRASRCWVFLKPGLSKQSSFASKLCLKPEVPLRGFLFLSCFQSGLLWAGLQTHSSSNPRSCISQPKPVSRWILPCGARARGAGGCCFQGLGRWFLPHNLPMAREQQQQHRWSWAGGSKTTAPTPMDPRLTPWGWSVPATPQFCHQNCFLSSLPSQELFLVSVSLVSPYSTVTWGGHQV